MWNTSGLRHAVSSNRRYELDWLRVIAFGILIYFHAAIPFIPGGLPLIQNGQTSPVLAGAVVFSSQFRLALLFFVAGAGIAFALNTRTPQAFLAERSMRLGVPLLCGCVLLVPPMVYLEKLHLGTVSGGFFAFYSTYFVSGVYPQGHLSWHHLWFVAYLYLYCLLGLTCFDQLANAAPNAVWRRFAQDHRIYLFVLPLIVIEVALRAFFPGFRDLVHDWASFAHWFALLLAGFVVGRHTEVLNNILRMRYCSLGLATLSTITLFVGFYDGRTITIDPTEPDALIRYVALCVVRMVMVWSVILACVGFARRYLLRPSKTLGYLNEAAYPLFLLHLPLLVALSFVAVSWPVGVWWKFLFVANGTLVASWALYHFCIAPFDLMRILFGMRVRRRCEAHQTRRRSA